MERFTGIGNRAVARQKKKKRLVFCFDGSWNRIDAPYPTNVLYTAQSVLPLAGDTAQIIFYDEGVGTEKGEELKGGMFGEGLVKNLSDGYRTLIFNYTPGDEVYVFGFSRGAFTARSFVGLISNCGILRRRDAGRSNEAIELYQQRPKEPTSEYTQKMLAFRSECSPDICVSAEEDEWRVANIPEYASGTSLPLKVKYMGIWDTVGSLGIPDDIVGAAHINAKHQFHNLALSGMVESARHAVAIDERRKTFRPTLWDNLDALNGEADVDSSDPKSPYQQQWFPGVHGSVGGGGDRRGLSDQALDWVWDGARAAGLVLDTSESSRVYELLPNHTEHLENTTPQPPKTLKDKLMAWGFSKLSVADREPGPQAPHEVSVSAQRRWHDLPENITGGKYRPATLASVSAELDAIDPVALGMGASGMEPAPTEFVAHEVKQGEWLSKLALWYYGDAEKWPTIHEANKYKISDPDKIYPGQVVRVPVIEGMKNKSPPEGGAPVP